MNVTANVVSTEFARAPATARSDANQAQLREHLRTLAIGFLTQHLQNFHQEAEQILFGLAENATDETLHSLYLDTISRLRNRRDTLRTNALAAYRAQLDAPVDYENAIIADPEHPDVAIAVRSLLAQTMRKFAAKTHAVDDVFKQSGGDPAFNPLSPARFCIAWNTAVDELHAAADAKFIVLKIFCKLVVNRLDSLYERALSEFRMQGLAPRAQLKPVSEATPAPEVKPEASPVKTPAVDSQPASTSVNIQKYIDEQVKNRRLPDTVRAFLNSTWSDVLNQTQQKHGVHSPQWCTALKTVDELASVVQPHDTATHHKKVLDTVPGLLCSLQTGIAAVNGNRELKDSLFNTLIATHARSIQYKKLSQGIKKPR